MKEPNDTNGFLPLVMFPLFKGRVKHERASNGDHLENAAMNSTCALQCCGETEVEELAQELDV